MAFLMSGSADVWPATKTRPGTLTAGPERLVRLQVFEPQKMFLTVVRLGRKFGRRDEFARHFECLEDVFDGWDVMLIRCDYVRWSSIYFFGRGISGCI